jgi:cell division protein FtsQ
VALKDTETAEVEGMPLPEDSDGEGDSPYLRRPKAVTVRRGRGWQRLRGLLYLGAVVVPLGIASYFLTTFALSSPSFELVSGDDVQVIGNRFVSREEIANALGLPLHARDGAGLNVFRLSLEAKRQQVESIAWVRSAAVTRILPNRLQVRVVERNPVAFVNVSGAVDLVDGNGVLLDRPQNAPFDFPVITGLDTTAGLDERRTRMGLFQDFVGQIGEEISQAGWMVSEVDLSDLDDLKALLVQGRDTVQVHFGHESFRERFHNFLSVLQELRKNNTPLDSMDLRYRNQVVINPQPASAAPAAAAGAPSHTLKE